MPQNTSESDRGEAREAPRPRSTYFLFACLIVVLVTVSAAGVLIADRFQTVGTELAAARDRAESAARRATELEAQVAEAAAVQAAADAATQRISRLETRLERAQATVQSGEGLVDRVEVLESQLASTEAELEQAQSDLEQTQGSLANTVQLCPQSGGSCVTVIGADSAHPNLICEEGSCYWVEY